MILRKKLYWWSHGTNGNQGTVGLAIRSFFYRYSDGILAYSCKAQENLHRMGVRDTKIQVVNNSLNFDDYGFLLNDIHSKRSQESLKILFCGRITKSKKIHLLIEAVGILKSRDNINAKCTIIGNGELSELSRLASKHNVTELIHFTGENYGFDLHKYFLESDIFVYPGGIGLSIVQALSFGLPVITTDNIALHGPEIELLEAGITGDFFKDDSAEQLADTIKIWASKISDPTNNIRENAVKKIIELGYLPDVMIDKINGFLEKEFAVNQTRIYV
jgi:glycosyltransferase involved in cell wall biosynthesis